MKSELCLNLRIILTDTDWARTVGLSPSAPAFCNRSMSIRGYIKLKWRISVLGTTHYLNAWGPCAGFYLQLGLKRMCQYAYHWKRTAPSSIKSQIPAPIKFFHTTTSDYHTKCALLEIPYFIQTIACRRSYDGPEKALPSQGYGVITLRKWY